jgi:hypothetical protein
MEKNFQWPHVPSTVTDRFTGTLVRYCTFEAWPPARASPTPSCSSAPWSLDSPRRTTTTRPPLFLLTIWKSCVFYIATIAIASKKWCPFNRRQNWWSDVAFLTEMGRCYRFVGLLHDRHEQLFQFLLMGLLVKRCLKTVLEIDRVCSIVVYEFP